VKEDFLKTKKMRSKSDFRFRPGSGRFSNMRFILENPTEVFTRVVTIYERRIRQSQGNIVTPYHQIGIQEYKPQF